MPWDRGRPGGWCVQPWVGALYALPRPASGIPSPPGPGPSSWRKTPCRCSRLASRGSGRGVGEAGPPAPCWRRARPRPWASAMAGAAHAGQQTPSPEMRLAQCVAGGAARSSALTFRLGERRPHRIACPWPHPEPRTAVGASDCRSTPRTSRARRLLFLGFSVYVGVGKPPHCHRTCRTDAAHKPRARGARAWL